MKAPLRLLYIDDDPGLGRLVERQLGRAGYEVDVKTSGIDGLERLATERYDAVALDHYMPGQDGLETLAAIRALPDPPPVVYVTGTQESRVAIAALKAGAADYVIKEVQGDFVELLRSAIDDAVEKVDLRRASEAAQAEVRAARDRFEALAVERELLLREMNHRVANSLQIITSLLGVQGAASPSPEVKAALTSACSRVAAVARVHRRLDTSEQITAVAADQYLLSLLNDLQVSSRQDSRGIILMLAAEPFQVDPDRAVAMGMIVSELIINAAKYAYPSGEGPVRVGLRLDDGRVHLTVEDDGVGFAAQGEGRSRGLGTLVVQSMASKLGAELTYESGEPGVCVRLVFPQFREADHVVIEN